MSSIAVSQIVDSTSRQIRARKLQGWLTLLAYADLLAWQSHARRSLAYCSSVSSRVISQICAERLPPRRSLGFEFDSAEDLRALNPFVHVAEDPNVWATRTRFAPVGTWLAAWRAIDFALP
jgi:hypothetical protein